MKSEFAKETTDKQIDMLFENWTIEAHWKDSGNIINNESGFSATLFKGSDDEYVLAFRGSNGLLYDGGNDFIIADFGDIVLDGFALKQSIDLINFRQQLLGNKDESYKASVDTISEVNKFADF